MAIAVFALSLTIYEIIANQNAKILSLKIKVKVNMEKNATCTLWLAMLDSILVMVFQNFSYMATYIYANLDIEICIAL